MNNIKIAIIGLGYVGLPLLNAFSDKFDTIGFDINKNKINKYKEGIDLTGEIGNDNINKIKSNIFSNSDCLQDRNVYIITVPTPITEDKTPDFRPLISASDLISKYLEKGDLVIYESTVYPGTTEEICVPILEETGLKFNVDFEVGYSPERINPGDKINTLDKITKVVSGSSEKALERVSEIYETIITAGIHKAESIKVAEAAKVIENAQRDINIAFINELAMIFDMMEIETSQVLKAASTKWNFLNFKPGLVGGHCIGVDPYYFVYKAKQLGYNSEVINAGRKINDELHIFIANKILKLMIDKELPIKQSTISVFGLTFKEDTPDMRNSKIFEVMKKLNEFQIKFEVYDPHIEVEDVSQFEYITLVSDEHKLYKNDVIIFSVAHKEFIDNQENMVNSISNLNDKIIIDIKNFITENIPNKWSL